MESLLLISMGFPAMAGIILLVLAFSEHLRVIGSGKDFPGVEGEKTAEELPDREHEKAAQRMSGRSLSVYVGVTLILSVSFAMAAAWTGNYHIVLFQFLDNIPVYFHVDEAGKFFITIVAIVWLAVGMYSIPYMKHEGGEKRYYGFLLLCFSILTGFIFAGNLITMYLFYELITLVSMPFVMFHGTKEAVRAARKYLFYSLCGAYGGLFGIYFLYRYCGSLTFAAGGTLDMGAIHGHEGILLIAIFVMLVGFGVKAGMLPMHAWLPTAHPVAPSPASAALSAVIVKAGVIAIFRVVFYIVGADFLRGTWVQYVWMIFTLATVFMGSMLAFREQGFKKRLAYSTVSQISYILFGFSMLTPKAIEGALLHTAAHGVIKCGLFLTAGVFLYCLGYTKVDQLEGIGKKFPKVMWCYTICSLGLIGIPPTCGFVSKWYLALGSLQSDIAVFSWLGPVILLVSALLTAGYLLPITLKGFFPGNQEEKCSNPKESLEGKEISYGMLIPLMALSVLVILLGIFPKPFLSYINEIVISVLGH